MTMKATARTMGAGQFKARCLALIDEVATTRREVVITKRGKPLAKLVALGPADRAAPSKLIARQDDLVSPIDADWDAAR
jgi:prevent-host-death family protein